MVRLALLLALALAPLKLAGAGVSDTAEAFLENDEPFLGVGEIPALEANRPLEDFFVVTIISLPFTALYGLMGATAYDSIQQSKFPPRFETQTLTRAGIAALAASVLIGTFSVSWGGSKKATKK